ncbi:MAG TPA: ribosome small subunit-dependent GTPase A [Longimicrobiales bacterium]|nr:ribosome small subunit-dependent GTPase A [Longimicrobiales bacterium]
MYSVVLDDGRAVDASLRGRLKQSGSPVVIGDRVSLLQGGESAYTIEAVEPRATELVRRGRAGRAPKVVAANLDRVFAVVSLVDPPATTELVDRLLVMIEASGMHPLLVLNKVDIERAPAVAEELVPLYESVGYRTFAVSSRSGAGLEALGAMLCQGSSALIGPSGVGKSSILNALDPHLELRTGEISGRTSTGRHTTVSSRLIRLECGGAVADTPGFGEVALWGIEPGEVAACFPEMREPAAGCRFRRCTHLHEPDCGVRDALEEGRIPESRYRSYGKLRAEADEAAER